MPRTARLDIPGLLQHVIVRGIEKRPIFLDDEDRTAFVERFSTLLVETGTQCYAWALMTNHFHLLIVPQRETLAHFMRRLLTGYVVTFNRRHSRAGHLFQNRYKSIVCEEETYLLQLVRYIHLNPLMPGLVETMEDLDHYPWCGHSVLMGNLKLAGQGTKEILKRFSRGPVKGRELYWQFVADGIDQGRRDDLVGGGLKRSQGDVSSAEDVVSFDARVLGSGKFVEQLRQQEGLQDKLDPAMSLSQLIDRVGSLLNVSPEAIRRPSKTRLPALARGLVCYLAVRKLKLKGVEVGQVLCLGPSGVSLAIRRGEQLILEHPEVVEQALALDQFCFPIDLNT
jgi:REP element-mobilizing transposase RayT